MMKTHTGYHGLFSQSANFLSFHEEGPRFGAFQIFINRGNINKKMQKVSSEEGNLGDLQKQHALCIA